MTTICLIRHGETDWNLKGKLQGSTDIPLNDTGIRQAEKSAAHLNAEDYDVMVASPMKRAKRTAEIINTSLNLPYEEMASFAECSFGDAEGLTIEERTTQYPDKAYPNREEPEDFTNRVMSGVNEVIRKYPDKRVLIVAHGAVINAILTTVSNGEIGSGKTKLMNACISNIHYKQEKWEVLNYNQIEHLNESV
ncbi:histidine phosphatase family protein [Oceanobacillus manasiensis]|uniref:histidine phosphatase family protein n=1 Tax=Oceanobacillus manasiensis TaxID=586413 RepID=UPI0005A8B45F|nr:histidine phosphatase family protein [Oceanobacillus manasiensis]